MSASRAKDKLRAVLCEQVRSAVVESMEDAVVDGVTNEYVINVLAAAYAAAAVSLGLPEDRVREVATAAYRDMVAPLSPDEIAVAENYSAISGASIAAKKAAKSGGGVMN